MWLQQDIEIWKKIILKTQKWENFGSLALLARNNLWNFSSLYPFYKASYILSVTNRRTRSIEYRLICDFSNNYILTWIIIFDAKMRQISARSLCSLVIIYEISQIYFFLIKAISWVLLTNVQYYTDIVWLTNKIFRYRRIVRFKRQNAKISARSLRSLVI